MALGSRLRSHYIHRLKLMNETLDANNLYIRSTDYSRTIESVQYLLGGLYPVKSRKIGEDLVIHVRDYENETMIPHNNCPSLLADTAKAKIKLHEDVHDEAKAAFDAIKDLGTVYL